MRVTTHQMVAEPTAESRASGWSWAALVGALVVWAAGVPTFGLSFVLAPVSAFMSAIAWRRSPPDVVFWIGLALNGFLVLGLVALVLGGLGWA
jgi:hypothetical protein